MKVFVGIKSREELLDLFEELFWARVFIKEGEKALNKFLKEESAKRDQEEK